jgi:hypothetical protein
VWEYSDWSPTPDMASMARHRCAAYADVGIEQSDFERWSSEDRRFPLLFSAQAWHWIDPPALVTAWQAEIDTADGLGEAETRVYHWTKTYSTEDYVALLSTHSDHLILPAASRGEILEAIAEVIDGAGGSFPMTYATLLCLARAK